MTTVVQLAKALADPTRARIVRCLCQGPVCVCELADALEIGMSTLSTHLQTLRATGVVTADKRSKWVSYALDEHAETPVRALFESLAGPEDKLVRVRRDKHRLARRLALRENGVCTKGQGELDRHLTEIKLMNGTCECSCGCGCQNGEPCTCGECCNCGCNASAESTCSCQQGGPCTCGGNCNCATQTV